MQDANTAKLPMKIKDDPLWSDEDFVLNVIAAALDRGVEILDAKIVDNTGVHYMVGSGYHKPAKEVLVDLRWDGRKDIQTVSFNFNKILKYREKK